MQEEHHAEKSHIIVGGGLAGLFSARVLLSRGASNIYVIEKSSSTGGFLQHITAIDPLKDGRNFDFDFGTHFILCPKEEGIRDLLAEDLDLSQYHVYEQSLQEGHVLNGQVYDSSGCANISAFPADVQIKIVEDLRVLHNSADKQEECHDLLGHCHQRYGKTATELIYQPSYEKFTGVGMSVLPVSVESFFAPSRLIIKDREESKNLKKDADWDWRIAYADCRDGNSDIIKYYPKKSGIGFWLNTMADNLRAKGVTILTETEISSIEEDNGSIKSVTLSNNTSLPCQQLIWSLPAIFLATLTKTLVPSQRPIMRHVTVVNILTDKKPIERPYWMTIYDKHRKSYRVTLYNNFAPTDSDVYRITVEILHDGNSQIDDAFSDHVFTELKEMKIVDSTAKKLWSDCANKKDGFPIVSQENKDIYIEQHRILENKYKNVEIVGRRPDIGFGQIPIMQHIYDKLQR